MSDIITGEELKDLRQYWTKDFITFSKKGMTLHYRGSLKEFFVQDDQMNPGKKQLIEDEVDFERHFGNFKDFVLGGSGSMEYCGDNDRLYPYNFGLTNAPLFSFGGFLYAQDELPIQYAFMYFYTYQINDWVEVLIREKKVTFETFINNSKIHQERLKDYES